MIEEQHSKYNTGSLVWYAAYGSNLQRKRFICYLEGGAPPNALSDALPLPKCDAGTEIRGDKPFLLGFKLYFADETSRTWGDGGVAFVGIQPVRPFPTRGRAYLLTVPQFICVAKEENGGSHPVVITNKMLSTSAGATHEITTDHQGRYRVLLVCGSINEIPVVTLTGWPKETTEGRLPSKNYLKTIREGLHETYPDMSYSDIEKYLRASLHETCSEMSNGDIEEYLRNSL